MYSFRDARAAVVVVAHVTQQGQEQVQVVPSLPLSVLRPWHRKTAPRLAQPWCPLWQHLLWVMRRSCAVPSFRSVITPQPAVLGDEKGNVLFACVFGALPCPAQVLLWVWVKPQVLQGGQSSQSPGAGWCGHNCGSPSGHANLTLSLRLLPLTASELSPGANTVPWLPGLCPHLPCGQASPRHVCSWPSPEGQRGSGSSLSTLYGFAKGKSGFPCPIGCVQGQWRPCAFAGRLSRQ